MARELKLPKLPGKTVLNSEKKTNIKMFSRRNAARSSDRISRLRKGTKK